MKHINKIIIFIIAFFLLIPLYWMISGSFKGYLAAIALPPQIYPYRPTLENYGFLFQFPIFLWLINSIIVSTSAATFAVITTASAGYAMQIIKFKGSKIVLWMFIISMMIPGHITLIPLYIIVKRLGLFNTRWAMILPGTVSAYFIFFYYQYLKTFPIGLFDVAEIDGAGDLRKFFQILLPLTIPALVTIGIFSFMGQWNNFFWQLVVNYKDKLRTLPVGIVEVVHKWAIMQHGLGITNHALRMAGASVAFIPLLILFLSCQRYFRKGLYQGAFR